MVVDIASLSGKVKTSERREIKNIVLRAERRLRLPGSGEISIVFVSARQSRRFNSKLRGINKPTTVLSFPSQNFKTPKSAGQYFKNAASQFIDYQYGEIFVCRTELEKYAQAAKLDYKTTLRYLIIHSLLHCLGYHHGSAKATYIMENTIRKILA